MPWLRASRMRAASAPSLVVIIPPSPTAMVFTGWKEKVASVPWRPSPTRACAPASS